MVKVFRFLAAVLSTLSSLLLFAIAGGASVKGW
jgi:hypothetical protein